MRLTQIRDFLAVIECGSIRAAARKLGVAQPTVTKSVRSLEEELHVQLLARNARGVVPTRSGRAFFTRARVAQSELHKAEEEAAEVGGSSTGSVTFGVGPAAGFLIVPEAIGRFRNDFPKAQIRIVEGFSHVLLPLVRDETLDFTIGARRASKLDPAFTFRPLFRHDMVVVARKGHPLRNAHSLAELTEAEWINFISPGVQGGRVEAMFSSAGLRAPQQLIQCDSFHTAIGLLAKNDMLGLMSRRLLTDSFARDFLQQIAVSEPLPSFSAGMFTRTGSPLTPLASALAKAVVAAARALVRRG